MYDLIRPAKIEQSDSEEPVVDKTSTNNLAFYHEALQNHCQRPGRCPLKGLRN